MTASYKGLRFIGIPDIFEAICWAIIQSRALVVHARSLEIYEQLGLSGQVVAEGQKNDGINFYKNGKIAASVTLGRCR